MKKLQGKWDCNTYNCKVGSRTIEDKVLIDQCWCLNLKAHEPIKGITEITGEGTKGKIKKIEINIMNLGVVK